MRRGKTRTLERSMDALLTALRPYESASLWLWFLFHASPSAIFGIRAFRTAASVSYSLIAACWFAVLAVAGVVAEFGALYIFHVMVLWFIIPAALNALAFIYPISNGNT